MMRTARRAGLLAGMVLLASAGGCTRLTVAWADMDAAGPAATPPLFEGAPSLAAWEAEKPEIRALLEAHIYGAMPDASTTEIAGRRVVDAEAFGGKAVVEEIEIRARATFSGVERAARPFIVTLVLPTQATGASPVIVMESFCPRADAIPVAGVSRAEGGFSCNGGAMSGMMTYVFGRYIATPPIEMILDRGYAIAALYPSESVPDDAETGLAALAALAAGHQDPATRWGAVAAWGWMFSRTLDALAEDARIDAGRIALWGHSRYGKAALVAGAFDARVAAVIAHQSGTGGASLSKEKKGESVGAITESYPHWFAPAYAAYAGREEMLPVDQHHLLALIAPRPVLLGNARRDVWSDPNGAFRAAMAADAAYALYGADGLAQDDLRAFNPQAELSFWIRPGTHGVVKEDWPAFLNFLDAHLMAESAGAQ